MIKLYNPNNNQVPIVEAYVMEFGSIGVLFLGNPSFECFKYFKPSTLTKQIIINHQGRLYLNSSYKVNLCNLKNIQYQTVDIVVVSDFRTYYLLPYILRQKKLPILMTQPMYQFGKIFSNYFLELIINQNRYCEQRDFMKQNQAFDQIEQQYDIDLSQFRQIYQANELNAVHLQITSLNPGQIYNFSELQITPFNSGSSIAECMWSVKVKSNGNRFTILMNGSFESWKHCKQIQVERIIDSSYLILGQNLINTQHKQNLNSNTVLSEFISNVQKSLRSGVNVNLLAQSSIHVIDLIQVLNYHLGNSIKKIIVLDSNFSSYLKYANSFVQYLNPIRANNIHNDPPQYPFSSLDRLFKNILCSGTILSLAMQQKVPTKQILLRHNPAIWIHPAEIDCINKCQENFINILDQRMKLFQIQNWISKIRPKNIIGFQKGTKYYTSQKQMELNVLNYQSFTLTKSIDFGQQYYLKNGIVIESTLKKYRLAPKDWSEKIFKKLSKLGIESKTTTSTIQTASSKLILKDYTFQITSLSIDQCQLLFKALDNI